MRSSRPIRLCAVLGDAVALAGLAAGCTESCEGSSDTSTAPASKSHASSLAAVPLVERHVHLGLAFAERAYVLSNGTLVLTAPAAELPDNTSRLQVSYLREANGGVVTTDRMSP